MQLQLINPAAPSDHIPAMCARLVASQPPSTPWSTFLPLNPVVITGRVPAQSALRYLSDSRLSPTKELVVVAFTPDSKTTEDERKTWEQMVEYHISRE